MAFASGLDDLIKDKPEDGIWVSVQIASYTSIPVGYTGMITHGREKVPFFYDREDIDNPHEVGLIELFFADNINISNKGNIELLATYDETLNQIDVQGVKYHFNGMDYHFEYHDDDYEEDDSEEDSSDEESPGDE